MDDFSDLFKEVEEIRKINKEKKYYDKQITRISSKLQYKENLTPQENENLLCELAIMKYSRHNILKKYSICLNKINMYNHILEETIVDVINNF